MSFYKSLDCQIEQCADLRKHLQTQNEEIGAICKILKITDFHFVTGIGKSGHIAHKFADTLSSIGVPAFYFDPINAAHGDLGRLKCAKSFVLFSKSGETKELIDLVDFLPSNAQLIIITNNQASTLAEKCNYCLEIKTDDEGNRLNLPPMTSTLQMELVANSLISQIMWERSTSLDEFKMYHPGGDIGKQIRMT